MSLLLLGSKGQLGQAFFQRLSEHGFLLSTLTDINFIEATKLIGQVQRLQPKIIINAAAYTSVDEAETEPNLVFQVNSQMVAILAEAATQVGALLVHFSTDYVFDGSGTRAWRETDVPAPLNLYGQSKWQGEQAIIASGCRHLIFRTSWLHSPYRKNFLKAILHLGQEKKSLSIVCDQIGAPTSAAMLAKVTLQAIEQTLVNPALCGLYHVAAAGETSWYEYACFIFAEAKALGSELRLREVKPVRSHFYPLAASRPLNSRLDTAKFRATFGIELPDWRDGVRETLRKIIK